MSLSWRQRKTRLASLLKSQGDENADAEALDRLMHGQTVIGKTAKTTELDGLRFGDKDLNIVGTLYYGQFGVIDVVTCRMNNIVYIRKSIEKRFALRTRDQCSPQFERDLLLQALKTDTPWAPHLLCAFQTTTHLNLVMDYAEGGTLWDVLESSPHNGRVLEADLRWWAPQIVSAIHWCHSQGFAHRDIKPHNFVLTPDAHVLLIDFGSAAPLLPPDDEGRQFIPRRYCLVPCGTCDYISPEILEAHEAALVALEMDEESDQASEGYGVETDWWSMGAMLYEMAYGVAPFFANDIKHTYLKIVNHEKSLRFNQKVDISHECQHFLRRLLTHPKQRIGRRNVMEITDHPLFQGVNWATLHTQIASSDLHLPQYTYTEPKPTAVPDKNPDESASLSQGFAFSVFFQQSSSASPGFSVLRPSPGSTSAPDTVPSLLASVRDKSPSSSSFIGFSWGPPIDAFPEEVSSSLNSNTNPALDPLQNSTPRPLMRTPLRAQQETPLPPNRTRDTLSVPSSSGPGTAQFSTPRFPNGYTTPMKPYALSPFATLTRTSTIRRTGSRRPLSDREAMKQLVDCVGMSARKKVLESGRKPKILGIFGSKGSRNRSASGSGLVKGQGTASSTTNARSSNFGTLRKELRFDRFTTPIPGPDYSAASSARSRVLNSTAEGHPNRLDDTSDIYYYPEAQDRDARQYSESETSDSEGGAPPSPSPSPRPGSAMSMMSMTMMSRRSGTPTISGYFGHSGTMSSGRMRSRSGSGSALASMPLADRSVTTTTTSTGLLSIPSAGHLGNSDFKMGKPPPPPQIGLADEKDIVPQPRAPVHDQIKLKAKAFVPPAATVASVAVPSHAFHRAPSPVREESKRTTERARSNSYSTLTRLDEIASDEWLADLERRHFLLMQDIDVLENKLDEVSSIIARR